MYRYEQDRLRYYGLHANATCKGLKDKIPDLLQRNGATVCTVLKIVRAMLGLNALECESCKGTSFEKKTEAPDSTWVAQHIVGSRYGFANSKQTMLV